MVFARLFRRSRRRRYTPVDVFLGMGVEILYVALLIGAGALISWLVVR